MLDKVLELLEDETSIAEIKGEHGGVYKIPVIENQQRLAERIVELLKDK